MHVQQPDGGFRTDNSDCRSEHEPSGLSTLDVGAQFGFGPTVSPKPAASDREDRDCGGGMKMIATIMRADVVIAILDAQGLPTEAPFIRPCRGPPSGELFEVWWR